MASPADIGEVAAVSPDLSIPEQHVAVETGEDIDYVTMPMASYQRASVLLYLGKAGYDINIVHTDGFTRAISQVKWSIPNPSRSTATDLLRHAVKDLRSLYVIEPILSLLKDTFYDGGLGSSIAKSDLIDHDHDHDHEEGTHEGSSKVKHPSATSESASWVCALPTGRIPSMTCEATSYQQILTFLACQPVPFVVVVFVVRCFNCAVFNYFSYAKMYCSIGLCDV